MDKKNCSNIQKSMTWCQGKPEKPGIRKRVFFTTSNQIAVYPTIPVDENGRPTSGKLEGSAKLVENGVWHCIDHLPAKADVKTETQGEIPSQTIKETVTVVHPSTGEEASDASARLLNADNVFIIEDMDGTFRWIGNKDYPTTTTVAQDLGQGATGTKGTTITIEATDIVSLPIYEGEIVTEDGVINEAAGA